MERRAVERIVPPTVAAITSIAAVARRWVGPTRLFFFMEKCAYVDPCVDKYLVAALHTSRKSSGTGGCFEGKEGA